MASYHHQAFFQSVVESEYFDESRNDRVITKIKVLFDTTNLETHEKVRSTYHIKVPPPTEKFIPHKQVDHHVLRKWASMCGDAIYYQDANVERLNDSVEREKNCSVLSA